ncbi:SusC/RagA family TonB-linked outer membrane protein [Sinomicrobium weinanense]|uniref:TonB-dependent receptor n=1 Tax=Sinomicrobium weinanense TaxID=2842200 RepID=A0A926JQK4_9FLAO|nr:TonB-dependent receptor [Sinomicrobium weinanense]MBC9795541.1 TonB-dependent receptor [Sinomicrobium weinanense]MBU3123312.1 TonB-dependent receptor [Sinomicrobium weinanense]
MINRSPVSSRKIGFGRNATEMQPRSPGVWRERITGNHLKRLFLFPVLAWFLLSGTTLTAQQKNISGIITAEEDGIPLMGVNIVVKGKAVGTVTGPDGDYALSVPDGSEVLVFSFMGFETQEIPINNRPEINVVLKSDSQNLDEVVVIGYGTQKKRDVTGAISSVSEESIVERQPVDVFDALQGQAAGVQINTDSRPGGGASIRIRGTATLQGGQDPLYVVDGVPMDNINGINPNDIQSMEILKDAASGAIYGSRSANGVVIITTKKGVEGKPRIDVRYNVMFSELSHKLPQATADDRRLYDRKRTSSEEIPSLNSDSLNPSFNADNDLQSMLTRTAVRHQLDLSVSGASDKMNYYANLGYLSDEGIIINSWSRRARSRINLDFKLSPRLTFGNRMNFSFQSENRINEGMTLSQAMQRPPTFQVYFPDGSLAPTLGGRRNPVAWALLYVNEFKYYEANVYNYLTFNITDDLKITSDFNVRAQYGEHTFFSPKLLSNDLQQNSGGYSNSFDIYWMQQNYLNYDKTINEDHTINAVLGMSAEKWVDNGAQIEGNTYVSESILTTNAIQDKILSDIYNDRSTHTLVGIFARLGYSYKGKYIFNANIRRDGSSRFGKENRWGTFPSASVGWRFSDESFMQGLSNILDDGKLRASYGETGNERIGNYDALDRYTFGNNYYNGVLGIVPSSSLGNSELSWETTKQFNVGIDLTFLKNRINFVADYYKKTTEDLLYSAPLPGEVGYTSTRVNIGSIQNEGFEFAINTYPVRNEKFTWNLSYNMSFNKDKVLKLYDGIPLTPNGRWYLEEGGRLGDFYGWKNLGVYRYDESNAYTPDWQMLEPVFNNGEFSGQYLLDGQPYGGEIKQLRTPGGVSGGGDVIWQNTNGEDDIIDDKDRVVLANAQPKFIAGIYNQFDYKSFSFSFNVYVQWGNTIYNRGRRNQSTFNGTNLTPDKYIIRDAWENPGDITRVPKVPDASRMGNMQELNSYFLEDGSFIRLRNVKLTYKLNPVIAEKLKMDGLSVYLYGNNLLTWTNYLWYDPEIPMGSPLSMGEDNGRYPRSRQMGLGLNINF